MSNQPDTTINPWQTHTTKVVYENPWIRVEESQVTNPSGGQGIYGVVHFLHRAVGVIPIDDEDHTWLVGQYRYATNRYEWEIPEGGCKPGEELADCARRELQEEAGVIAGDLELLVEAMQTSNSVCNEHAWVFVARNLEFGDTNPDDTESLETRRVPLEEAFAMVERGEIRDSMSVAGLLRLKVARLNGEH